jgi:hypothetical protein
MAAALIDRLVHHCHIVNILGNSYRMRQHRELASRLAGIAPRPPPPARPAGGLMSSPGRRRAECASLAGESVQFRSALTRSEDP